VKLPNYENVDIPQRKLTHYLLDLSHESGRGKAIFFLKHGFLLDEWEKLRDALKQHAANHDIVKIEQTRFGTRYVIEGFFYTLDKRNTDVRSVWFIENDSAVTRFVTAYPLEEQEK
jgi:hypothetical protein